MRYVLGKGDWQTKAQGESRCFLLANGLGGYSSQTVIGSNARNDHAVFISAKVAPSERWTMVSRLDEVLYIDGKAYDLASQSYVTRTQDQEGFHYLNRFVMDGIPEWEYMAEGVRVVKKLMIPYGTNSVIVTYEIEGCGDQAVKLAVTPVYGMHSKNDRPMVMDDFVCEERDGCHVICANQEELYLKTDGRVEAYKPSFVNGYYFEQDAVDGREGFGSGVKLHRVVSEEICGDDTAVLTLVYSTDADWMEQTEDAGALYLFACGEFIEELDRLSMIEEKSMLHSAAGRQLAVSASAYLTERESTGGMSIMAGFPFFGDWGRDTMIAFYGCTAAIGEDHSAKSILRTFMEYCRRGIMPNLFPEGGQEPMYNTVDASLLFINAAWEFLQKYPDKAFAAEVLPVVESIVCWYAHGTDYNIHMDSDYLLAAGSGQWQLTWMDVRFEDILPTPRHGKPVEINAYWYNAVKVLRELLVQSGDIKSPLADTPELTEGWRQMDAGSKAAYLDDLAAKIKESFLAKFTKPDGTLYDVLIESDDPKEKAAQEQVRCNQVFALTMPFGMLEAEQARKILAQIRRELYTPVGLRSLSPKDAQFHPNYGGAQFDRDMAYHQGTVWGYPLGAYYRACLRYAKQPVREAEKIMTMLDGIEAAMAEGCLGHLAEIYEGGVPGASKGCFAQAWSVAELLRVYQEVEAVLG